MRIEIPCKYHNLQGTKRDGKRTSTQKRAVLRERLTRGDAAGVLPDGLLRTLAASLERPPRRPTVAAVKRRVAKTAAGKQLLGLVKTRVRRPSLPLTLLALRAYLVVEATALLAADARFGGASSQPDRGAGRAVTVSGEGRPGG